MRKPEPWRLPHSIYAFCDRWVTPRRDTVRLPSGSTLAPYPVIEALRRHEIPWLEFVDGLRAGRLRLLETNQMSSVLLMHLFAGASSAPAIRRLVL